MYTTNTKVESFTVTTEQVIPVYQIHDIIYRFNKIDAIKEIRRLAIISLKDAKEIYEAVEAQR